MANKSKHPLQKKMIGWKATTVAERLRDCITMLRLYNMLTDAECAKVRRRFKMATKEPDEPIVVESEPLAVDHSLFSDWDKCGGCGGDVDHYDDDAGIYLCQ